MLHHIFKRDCFQADNKSITNGYKQLNLNLQHFTDFIPVSAPLWGGGGFNDLCFEHYFDYLLVICHA